MGNYRKIWSDHYGPIPKDETGRSYDIHHIDGNRKNNNINNLIAVPINLHYAIHYEQKDWMAAHAISLRMKMTVDERTDIIKRMSEAKKGKTFSDDINKKKSRPGPLNGMFNKKHKPESIELMKKNRIGKGLGRRDTVYKSNFKPMFGVNNPASKMVAQYDLDGNFITQFNTIKEAQQKTGANNISAVCRGIIKTSGNYIWKYV